MYCFDTNIYIIDPIQTVPIIYFIKQGTIRDFGIETITSEQIVEKIIQVSEIGSQPIAVPEQTVTPSEPASVPVGVPVNVSSTASTTSTVSTATTDEMKAKKEEYNQTIPQLFLNKMCIDTLV